MTQAFENCAMTEAEWNLVELMVEARHSRLWSVKDMGSLVDAVIAERAPQDPIDATWVQYKTVTSLEIDKSPAPQWFRDILKFYDGVQEGGR